MLKPYPNNPWYWEWNESPVLLAGTSIQNCVFQTEDMESLLEEVHQYGGNFIRCTLSSRKSGDLSPFNREPGSQLYDLTSWNHDYWDRLGQFMHITSQLQIFVQLEIWDRADFFGDPWDKNPFNPNCNSNYSGEESGLLSRTVREPEERSNPFFRTIPEMENNHLVLAFQERFVDKVLSVSLSCNHILYCMDNQTNESAKWPVYWNSYIKAAAGTENQSVNSTQIWAVQDLTDPIHRRTWEYPENYSYIDISQGNHFSGRSHWDGIVHIKELVARAGYTRPLTMSRIYGSNAGCRGTNRDAVERFWRAALAGVGALAFHNPPAGQGMSGYAAACLKTIQEIAGRVPLWDGAPAQQLLKNCSSNEAYCRRSVRDEKPSSDWFIVFFCDGGDVILDTAGLSSCSVCWFHILSGTAGTSRMVTCDNGQVRLVTPEPEGYQAALVKRGDEW